ncbi:MAG: DUF2087 domain-containing protein [Candidatus Eisenbacteria bacterium]|nr:DUF2087 domain-containing protein [Candidatus Eisenbacteria bacterium]
MAETIIDRETFISRLTALCVRSTVHTFPRRRSDRAILLKSIAQRLDAARGSTEGEVNAAIQDWLQTIAPALETDHVSLRRYLVDEGFLERSADGATYRPAAGAGAAVTFAGEVDAIDVREVVSAVRRTVAARREEHRRRSPGESGGETAPGT